MYLLQAPGWGQVTEEQESGGDKAWGGNDAEKCNIKAMTVQVKVHLTWKDYLIEKLLFGVSPADHCLL